MGLPSGHLIYAQHSRIETEIAQSLVEQRSLHIVATPLLRPDDRGVVVRNVTGGIRPDGINRLPLSVRIGYDHQAVLIHRRGNRYVTPTLEAPQFLSSLQVIAADVLPSVHHHLPTLDPACGIRHYGGRAECGHIVAWCAP